jgi:hypothetical protein
MANLVQLSNDLESVPKEQLIQMSQDPNSTYPSYLVLAEIQRRTQMEKMYAAQQPKPQTTVAEEVVSEFASSPSGLGAMAQSSDSINAFPSGEMGNMAPPSPMQIMASGGITGYNEGGDTKMSAYKKLKENQQIERELNRALLEKRMANMSYREKQNYLSKVRFQTQAKNANPFRKLFEMQGFNEDGVYLGNRPSQTGISDIYNRALGGETIYGSQEKYLKQLDDKIKNLRNELKLNEMGMANGGLTGYQVGGLTEQTIKEASALGIDITNLSNEEIVRQVKLANDKRRKDMLLGMTPDTSKLPINQPLPTSQDLLNLEPLPKGLQAEIDKVKEPSRFDEIIEGGTQFFFGDPRPDAERPNLARATDEFTDYLNIIPGAAGLKLGASGLKSLIQGSKAFKQSGKLDELVDLTKINPSKISQADNILPTTIPKTSTTNLPAVMPKTGTNLIPQGGPLAVIPKVAKESKGLMNKAIDFLKNNKTAASILGIGGITTAYSLMNDAGVDTNDTGDDDSGPKTKEIKQVMDPLDLAKLGGIIMGARNTSELGQGITALAGDIQERRYKEKVLTSKEEQALINRLNAITKALESVDNIDSEEYTNLVAAQNAIIQQINTMYGIEKENPMDLINKLTVASRP